MSGPKQIDEGSPAAGDSRRDRAVRGARIGLGLLAGLWMIAIVSGVLGFRPFPEIPFVSDDAPPGSIWFEAGDRGGQAGSEPAPPFVPAESGLGSGGPAAPIPTLAVAGELAPPAVAPRPRPGAGDGGGPRSRGGRESNRGPAPGASRARAAKQHGNSDGNGNGNAVGHASAPSSSANANSFGIGHASSSNGNGSAFGHANARSSHGTGNAFGHIIGKGHKH